MIDAKPIVKISGISKEFILSWANMRQKKIGIRLDKYRTINIIPLASEGLRIIYS